MATVTRTIAEQTAPANQESHSATRDIPDRATAIKVTLTSSQWANAALAGNRILWGVQLSYDSGATWGPGDCSEPSSNPIGGASASVRSWIYGTVIIGATHRGNLPSFSFSGDQITDTDGAIARLFVWPEVAIPLGASIVITF